MSDNISQLHPQKHPGLGKRIAVFAVLLVFVTGGVAAYVFRDRLNLDALQRYVRYLNVSDSSTTKATPTAMPGCPAGCPSPPRQD